MTFTNWTDAWIGEITRKVDANIDKIEMLSGFHMRSARELDEIAHKLECAAIRVREAARKLKKTEVHHVHS